MSTETNGISETTFPSTSYALIYQGYDKSPALAYDKVVSLTTGTVIQIIGFYIGGLNYASYDRGTDNSAISFTKELRKQYLERVNLAYIYVGRSDTGVSIKIEKGDKEAAEKGILDAKEAEKLAKALEIPSDSVIYLDVEGGSLHNDEVVKYTKSWVEYINDETDYWAGIYCSAGYQCEVAKQLYEGVNKKANMYVARWVASSGQSIDTYNGTGEPYDTSYSNPAKWYYYDPAERVPDAGCIVTQYSGNVHISIRGVETIVDQISSSVKDPSVKQFT